MDRDCDLQMLEFEQQLSDLEDITQIVNVDYDRATTDRLH